MMRVSKSVMAVGGVVLAGILIGVTNPKVVHAAVTALFVQVTNTASNPVITQSVGQQAAQSIQLDCSTSVGLCFQISNGQRVEPSFIVPANQSLVVTAVDINSTAINYDVTNGIATECNSPVKISIEVPGAIVPSLVRETFELTSPTHFTYPSGVVFAPSATLVPTAYFYKSGVQAQCESMSPDVYLYGYLTAN